MFLSYKNDLPDNLQTSVRLSADDSFNCYKGARKRGNVIAENKHYDIIIMSFYLEACHS